MIRSAIRWVARVLVILVLALLVGLGWLVGTTEGARFALRQASELEPALAARVAGGNLLTGVSLAAFHWSMPGVRVSADRLVLRWRPRCLVDATVCVDRLATDGLTVKVDPAQLGGGGGAGDASASSRLSIPVNIQIRDLSARETHVAVSGGADVRLARLKTGASMWHDSLHVATTTLSGLRVTLPETVAAESDTSKASESVSNKPPLKVALPAIHLPLDVELEGVTLTDARLIQDGRAWSLERLHTVAQVSGQSVRLKTLSVAMPGASGTLQGRVRLQGDWPLSLEIDGHLDRLLDAGAQSLHASLDGSLAKLEARLRATGAVQAQAHATARVLSPDIPWSLSLQSRSLGWPLTGHDTVAATDVSLTGSGDVGHYDLDVRAHLAGASVPPGNWHLKGEGDPQGARIESLTGRVLGGSLKASGRVAWAPRLSWDVDLQADALDPSGVVPQLPGKVNGHLAVKGDVPDNGWSLAVDIKGIDGTLRGYPLKLNGGVSHDAGGAWRFRDVVLRTGDNRVRIDGGLSDTWNLDADLALNRLAALWPGLGGHVKGSVKVSGATTTPSVAGTLTGSSIVWQDLRAGRVTLKANVRKLLRGDSTVDLAAIDLRQGERSLGNLQLNLDGRLDRHRLRLSADHGPVDGQLVVNGGLDLQQRRWSGRLTRGRLGLPGGDWTLAGAAALDVGLDGPAVKLGDQCWRHGSDSLCLGEPATWQPGELHAVADLKRFDLGQLKPWLPGGLALDASVGGRVTVDQTGGGRPAVTADLSSSDGAAVLTSNAVDEPVRFGYRRIALKVELKRQQATVDLSLASDHLGKGSVHLTLNPYADPRTIGGTVGLDGVQVAVLKPFLPQLTDLDGQVSADGRLDGTLTSPSFKGTVRLAGGRVAVLGLPVPVEGIQLAADINGQSAAVTGEFSMGAGKGRIGGTVSWQGAPRATVALTGSSLEFRYPPMVRSLTLSPAMTFSVTPQQISVNGRLSVPSGRIVVKSLPAKAVSVSDDAVIVNRPKKEQGEQAGPTLKSNIYLVLGDDVQFKGFGAEGKLAGSLQLRQVGTGGAEANGQIEIKDGRFEKYGQKLTIRTGQFLFAGPISQPRLNIEAVREVGSVVAGLRVTGSAEQPQATLFSEPSMPQEDILTYLVTGHAPGSATPSEQELVAQAALSAGVLGGKRLGGALAKELGVQDFQLEAAGEGDNTQVAVSGYLSPNLMVRYGVGVFQPENTLTLRYYMTKSLYLEAVSGFSSALDVFYSFNF